MKRKEFIAKTAGSLAALTVCNLLKINAENGIVSNPTSWIFYRKFQEAKGTEIIIRKFYFTIPKKKILALVEVIDLKVEVYDKGDTEKESLQVTNYQIPFKLENYSESASDIQMSLNCKKYAKLNGPDLLFDCEFEPLLSQKSEVMVKVDSGIATMQVLQKSNWLMTLEEFDPDTSDKDDECYLTTICVHLLGKQDDCYELQTLRSFRDKYIAKQSQGKQLIDSYYLHVPAIVTSICKSHNKLEIAQAMYTDLVTPTIHLIEQNRLKEAAEYYTNYALTLHKQVSQIQ
ncbi:MAG: hypothetical protein RLZZ337_1348 [Bacteroidota bacterium]|jgi:hypothetical protein